MTDVQALRPVPGTAPAVRPLMAADPFLIAAKLSRPEVPAGYLERPRLDALLDEATTLPLTVVTGGAGWGKTQLVASWAARASADRRVCWLSLDADDDDD